MPDEITPGNLLNLTNGPGQPIEKSTGELMMALYQARIKAIAHECPEVGVKAENEPKQIFFNLLNLNELITALNGATQHLATCLGLTVIDAEGNPSTPTAQQLELMQELVDLQAAGNYEEYNNKIKNINLAQTTILAGCDNHGNLIVNETGVYAFYNHGSFCCSN